MANLDARQIQKRSTVPGSVPTIPPSNNHLDGSWSVNDIYEGEYFLNIPDQKIFTRAGNSIIEITNQSTPPVLNDYIKRDGTTAATTGDLLMGNGFGLKGGDAQLKFIGDDASLFNNNGSVELAGNGVTVFTNQSFSAYANGFIEIYSDTELRLTTGAGSNVYVDGNGINLDTNTDFKFRANGSPAVYAKLNTTNLTVTHDYQMPDKDGEIALLSDITTFDPTVDNIGTLAPVDAAIVSNDTVNVFANKTQGQISSNFNSIIGVARATTQTGIISETDPFTLTAFSDTVLRIGAIDKIIFYNLIATSPATAVKTFAQQDYNLSGLGLTVDGLYERYIGYDSAGVVQVSDVPFTNNSVCQLGYVVVKRVAGVVTFLDGAAGPRNTKALPNIAGNNSLLKSIAPKSSTIKATGNATGASIATSAGNLKGIAINWGGADINNRIISAQAITSFVVVNPSTASSTTIPAATTAVPSDQYWNGSTLVTVGNNKATVVRLLMSDNALYYLQVGEAEYATFTAAEQAILNAPFSELFPPGTYTEVCRIAIKKGTTNLTDITSAFISNSAGGGGGGGAVASFNPAVDTINSVVAVNTPIIAGQTINEFAGAAQGQIDAINIEWVEGMNATLYSHSYGVVQTPANCSPNSLYMKRLLSRVKYGSITSVSNSGYEAVDVAAVMMNGGSSWTNGNKGFVHIDACQNSFRVAITGGAFTTAGVNSFQNSLRAMIYYLMCSSITQSTDASFVYAGSWNTLSQSWFIGGTMQASNDALPASCAIAITGTDFVLFSRGTSSVQGVATVNLDGGATLYTVNNSTATQGKNSSSTLASTSCPIALPFRGASAGAHIINFTKTSAGINGTYIDAVGIISPTPPTIIIHKQCYLPTSIYTGWGNGATDALVDEWNAAIDVIVAEFAADGNVVAVDFNADGWDKNTMTGTVSLGHPNDKGMAFIASSVIKKLASLNYRAGQNVL